ncbi:hypothetical protein GCM10027048_13420 [Hymenobacter coalescens]
MVGSQRAYATHAQGGELTYEALGNNRYRVTCRYFRDCSSTLSTEASLTLNCRVGSPTTSCSSNDSRNFTTPLLRGQLTSGTPYCSTLAGANVCSSSSQYANYETARYTADVTLPPAEEWTLSVQISARPSIENIGGNTTLRFEATLNNQLQVGSTQQTIQNTSPQYQPQDVPVPFVCVSQRTTLTFSTFEPDGDSLVYALDRPLEGCNDFSTYQAIDGGTGIIRHPTTPGCYIDLGTNSSQNYSPTLPIFSYTATGACPVQQGTPNFLFNDQLGSFTFTPALYYPNTAPSAGRNKYTVVGKVTEYRKINGRYYKVGSVRRDMLIIIIDCGGNTVPNPPVAVGVTPGSNTGTVNSADSTFITVYSCNYSQVRVRFTDPNPNQQLTVTIPSAALAPLADVIVPNGYALSGNGTTSPVATFYFQPSPQLVGTVVRIPIRVEDNACPVKAVQNRILVIRVLRGEFATAVAAAGGGQNSANPIICYGTSVDLRGSVVRPDSVRNGLQTYTYTWQPANGLAPADQNKQNITVRPTQTTRYRLRIAPTTGFSPGLCGDTTSIRVRVAPQVVAAFRTDSAAAPNSRFNRPPRVFTFTNQSRVNNVVTAVGIDSVRWTYQRTTDGKGQRLNEQPVRFSGRLAPGPLTLMKPGLYEIRLSVANRTPGATCPESIARFTVTVPQLDVPNVFTPNKDGLNDTFIVQAEQEGNKVEIFNRWGRKVKEFSNYNNDWDGESQPAGVYYYHITARDGKVTKGWVELVR